jgi:uncharacterized RDD family membrane protein YckC
MQGLVERSVGHSVECSAAEDMARQTLLATGTDGPESCKPAHSHADPGPTLFDNSASLREAAAARVAAHRSRRAGTQAMQAAREEAARLERAQIERDARRGVSRVRDTVRARYENSQSYRDFLAAEAERATQQARAEAEIAARNARAIADAQLQLLEELRQTELTEPPASRPDVVISTAAAPKLRHPERNLNAVILSDPERAKRAEGESKNPEADRPASTASTLFHHQPHRSPHHEPIAASGDLFADPFADVPLTEITTGGLTVRLYDDFGPTLPSLPSIASAPRFLMEDPVPNPAELEQLDHEIAFRRAPDFVDHIIGSLPLPANLIEFPRELVATRKARPRLAEGPLREDLTPEPQLRIFEVEPETISTAPAVADNVTELATDAPVWQGLLLDTPRSAASFLHEEAPAASSLADIASISRRLMAATVDACCIGAAVVAFATTVSWISGPRLQALSHPMLAAAAVITFAISTLIYQLLFFSLNEATPGMRYAHIALCTFAETYPSRRARRRRVLATVLAACPLGLGLLWAWMDDDRLGWHDRISRMYHRSY